MGCHFRKQALALIPKKESDKDVGDEADVDNKARFYTEVTSDIVDLASDDHEAARNDLRKLLRTREEKVDCDTHELLLLAAQVLITSDRDDPKAKENAEDDGDP